ncbi:MAG: hypothetical protein HQL56_17820 [Magnetococcales bacterium]|nr:hypothetical protein [Magnetococcales bacterium]
MKDETGQSAGRPRGSVPYRRPGCPALLVGLWGVLTGLLVVAPLWAADAARPTDEELRLTCERYADEDQVPADEVKPYVNQCVQDLKENNVGLGGPDEPDAPLDGAPPPPTPKR